ncbi:DUF4198 domain-containing protein [Primorskyibacter sp. 2E107]|uniref:DUF4198 domain-containing protein n=1 Tax=Primorskyibacter sp. 2E107 TaxID=3403458 RepID=UPI003AF5B266
MRFLFLAATLLATPLSAHEFWIDPVAPEIPSGGTLQADIRVGSDLKGPAYSFVPPNFTRFEVVMGDTVTEVTGRGGDKPALNMAAPDDGLAVIVHVTREYKLTYDSWEKFETFCTHKDFRWALERHLERGYTKERVRELYSRHAKSLIAVGDGAGADREVGLAVEIVAEANPYTDDLSGGFPVRALYNGAPRADVQVELFEQAPDGDVSIRKYRTDDAGRTVLDLKPGYFYLVDHVVMREIEPAEEDGPVWESLWASLTFEVPE